MDDLQHLMARLDRLETRNRQLRLAAVLAAIVVAAVLLVGGQNSPGEEVAGSVRTRKLIFTDSSGRHGLLSLSARGGEVGSDLEFSATTLVGHERKIGRLSLTSGCMEYYDAEGHLRMHVFPQGITLRDSDGKARLNCAIDKDGSPYVVLCDKGGTRAALRVFESDGTGRLELWEYNGPGSRNARLSVKPGGTASLAFIDANKRVRGEMGISGDGVPFLRFMDAAGDVSWQIPEHEPRERR